MAIELSESEYIEEYFNSSKQVQSKVSLSKLVDHYQTWVNITKKEKMTPLVVPHLEPTTVVQLLQSSKGVEQDLAIVSLIKKMDILVLYMTVQGQVPLGMISENIHKQRADSSPGNVPTQTAKIRTQRLVLD